MNNTLIRRAALACATLMLLTTMTACTSKDQAADSTPEAKVTANQMYSAAEGLPDRYENLTGTAFFSSSQEIADQLSLLGAKAPQNAKNFFLLLNPKNPTEGILVKATAEIPAGAASDESNHKILVTGPVKTIADATICNFCSERLGVKLAVNDKGEAAYIEMEQPLNLGGAAPVAQPAEAPATPSENAAPAEGTAPAESAAPAPAAGESNAAPLPASDNQPEAMAAPAEAPMAAPTPVRGDAPAEMPSDAPTAVPLN